AARISRLEEKSLGYVAINAELGFFLGTENIGVFVGGCSGLGTITRVLRHLSQGSGGKWVVLSSSRLLAGELHNAFKPDQSCLSRAGRLPPYWLSGKLLFSTPEHLERMLREAREKLGDVAGIIVLDMTCWVHRARGAPGTECEGHDRPQKIADFRSQLARGPWAPPLFVLTEKQAKAITTDAMLGPYCLEGFWFLNGATLWCDTDDE